MARSKVHRNEVDVDSLECTNLVFLKYLNHDFISQRIKEVDHHHRLVTWVSSHLLATASFTPFLKAWHFCVVKSPEKVCQGPKSLCHKGRDLGTWLGTFKRKDGHTLDTALVDDCNCWRSLLKSRLWSTWPWKKSIWKPATQHHCWKTLQKPMTPK